MKIVNMTKHQLINAISGATPLNELIGKTVTVTGFAIDDSNGTLNLITDKGDVYGTNSSTVVRTFNMLYDDYEKEGKFDPVKLKFDKKKGSNSNREFTYCTVA